MLRQILLAGVIGAAASDASAALLVYEGFDYNTGALLGNTNPSNGQTYVLAGPTAPTAINVTSGSLTAPSPLPGATGNSVAFTGNGTSSGSSDRLTVNSPALTTGTVYYSFLMRVDSLSPSNQVIGGTFTGLNNSTGAQGGAPSAIAAKMQGRIDPVDNTKFNLGVFNNRGLAAANVNDPSWSGALNVGETYFIVASYEIVALAGNDISRMWINPLPATFGAATAPAADETDTTAGTDIPIASILMRQSPAPALTADEFRVGTTWADVTVPEPGSLGLLGLAGLGLLARRRRSS